MRLGNGTTRGRCSRRQRTTGVARQQRLGIERIQMRRVTEHERHDDALDLRPEVGRPRCEGIGRRGLPRQHRRQGKAAESGAELCEPLPSRQRAFAPGTTGAKSHRSTSDNFGISSFDKHELVRRQQGPAETLPGEAATSFRGLTGQ